MFDCVCRCWVANTGKAYTLTPPSEVQWETYTCVLGYSLMGIWPPGSMGTDINAVDASPELNLCVSADDSGKLNLMNYPCVVKQAPRKSYTAHSSHVTNCKFVFRNDSGGGGSGLSVATVGGRDATFAVWNVYPAH